MNKKGITAMYDAVTFLLLVSISSAILLPAITYDATNESINERKMDEIADETLFVILSASSDEFEYTLSLPFLEKILGGNNMVKGIYGESIFNSFFIRKEYHKRYGELIGECLLSQLAIFTEDGKLRMNILTSDFEKNLRNDISHLLHSLLGEKYGYNLTAEWEPIYGIPFGGKFSAGEKPPHFAHVSKTFISLPLSGISREWMEEKIKEISEYNEENVSILMLRIFLHFLFQKIIGDSIHSVECINVTGNGMEIRDSFLYKLFGNISVDGIVESILGIIKEKMESQIDEWGHNVEDSINGEIFSQWLEERINIGRAEVCLKIWRK